jgi:hypothetical protein
MIWDIYTIIIKKKYVHMYNTMLRRVQHDTTSESQQELPPDAVLLQSSLTRKPKLMEEIHWNTT